MGSGGEEQRGGARKREAQGERERRERACVMLTGRLWLSDAHDDCGEAFWIVLGVAGVQGDGLEIELDRQVARRHDVLQRRPQALNTRAAERAEREQRRCDRRTVKRQRGRGWACAESGRACGGGGTGCGWACAECARGAAGNRQREGVRLPRRGSRLRSLRSARSLRRRGRRRAGRAAVQRCRPRRSRSRLVHRWTTRHQRPPRLRQRQP